MKSLGLFAIIASLLFAVGCRTLSTTTTLPNGEVTTETHADKVKQKESVKPRLGIPESIVPIWKDATLTLTGHVPTRGFAGRIYFEDQKGNPLIVEGDLVVYGFNESRLTKHGKPEKRFVFKQEELKKYLTISSAGPSYNIWLPWDRIGGVEKKVSLVVYFNDASGKVCQGSSIDALLPGTKDRVEETTNSLINEVWEKESQKRNVKKVGFQQFSEDKRPTTTAAFLKSEPEEKDAKRRVTEFRLTPGNTQRLFKPVPNRKVHLPKPKIYIPDSSQPNRSKDASE